MSRAQKPTLPPRATIHNDEFTSVDRLNRKQYARAFAQLIETCETPLVIGLYGSWGVGKTSLMKMIESELSTPKVRSVWFDPWQHQFDEAPAVALLHTLVDRFDMKDEGRKLITVIACAFGSIFLKATTSLKLKDILDLGRRFEEESFQVREARIRLQEHFRELIVKAQGNAQTRIVFFIDDLDRCLPSQALSMLESLMLYLNIPGCVYILGIDRHALERSIKLHYGEAIDELNYLDKIIQLPFTIPPIAVEAMNDFVDGLLTNDLKPCQSLLVTGLGNNPRHVKRFINTLSLNHQLAAGLNISRYDPKILATFLLIQYRSPAFYRRIASNPSLLFKFDEDNTLTDDDLIKKVIKDANISSDIQLTPYIYLTQVAKIAEVTDGGIETRVIVLEHEKWLKSPGLGKRADFGEMKLIGENFEGANLARSNFGKTDLQKIKYNGCNLSESSFFGAYIAYADFSSANLARADFRGANIENSVLKGADLSFAKMRRSILNEPNLEGAVLTKADLSEAIFKKANMEGANLTYASLSNADLQDAQMRGCNLTKANLEHTCLSRVDLSSSTLCEANLWGADLRGANLRDADMRHTRLCRAKLERTDLRDAKLAYVDFSDAVFQDVDMRGADLLGAIALTEEQLKSAIIDQRTSLPDGYKGFSSPLK